MNIKIKTCKECKDIEFIGRDDYPYCYEMFRLGWGIRKVPLDSISDLCPSIDKSKSLASFLVGGKDDEIVTVHRDKSKRK